MAAQRFTTLDSLVRDLVVLCASRALAGSTRGHESAATSPLGDLTLTVDRLTSVASWRLFKDFLPDAQEGAVDQVRETMFKTCGKIRAGQAIDVRRLVRVHHSTPTGRTATDFARRALSSALLDRQPSSATSSQRMCLASQVE